MDKIMNQTLMSAEALRCMQEEYLKSVDDAEMQHIIAKLNNAYKEPARYKYFTKISLHNIEKLRSLGYTVKVEYSQIDGTTTVVSW